ncbi:MAG: PAS domain-containing protein [Nitrospirae bacterium]|nr:PAS domain-containing protein [Nitrospirota bacterium]
MKDGVMTIDFEGRIITFNRAAEEILEIDKDSIINKNYAEIFLLHEENDDFNQVIFDAVYESSMKHNKVVSFNAGSGIKTLSMTTTYLSAEGRDIGVISVFNDITELTELRDALRAMEEIKRLNNELEVHNKFIRGVFGRYLSDDIVRSLIETPGGLALGGKKEEITIMMTDLRGFTSLSERLLPETVVAILNNYLAAMTDIILKYKGTIDEFIGDAILVLFGAPISCADHAQRAVACALEMQLAMEVVNQYNRDHGFPNIEMGIGINTGNVVVGNVGSSKRTKYGVVGRNVNLTSRIESYTTAGQVFISSATKERITQPLRIISSMEVAPKGVKEPITIYNVGGIGGIYDLYLQDASDVLNTLERELVVNLSIVEGKDTGKAQFEASVVKLSNREAIMLTTAPVEPLCNMRFFIKGPDGVLISDSLYGKVIEKMRPSCVTEPGVFSIRVNFTSIPSEVSDYFKGLLS